MGAPKIGQILYSLNVGNAARGREQVLTPVEVVAVGRKYFTTHVVGSKSDYTNEKYYIDDWREHSDYCALTKLYVSPEDYAVEKAVSEMESRLRDKFRHYYSSGLSFDELTSICAIVDSSESRK